MAYSPQYLNVQSIGGIAVGTPGSGIYSGYTLSDGDDFNAPLNVINMGAPYARYGTTHVYGTGARSIGGQLANSYDMDPYHTGSQDLNRGVAVAGGSGVNTMSQSGTSISLRARAANAGETAYTNTRPIVSSMIHTGSYVVTSPPCIIEFRARYINPTLGYTSGWHPTTWVLSSNPIFVQDGGASPGAGEFDWSEGFNTSSIGASANYNPHGTTIGPGVTSFGLGGTPIYDGNYHLFTLILDGTSAKYYLDGSLITTVAQDCTNYLRPFYLIMTSHTFNSEINLTNWASAGANACTMEIDYYRIWGPAASATLITPLVSPAPVQTAYNTTFSYTFPSLAALWGGAATSDYPAGLRHEDFEPGATSEGGTNYVPFPADLSWNAGTRVLSGKVTSRPGRLHLMASAYQAAGGVARVFRDYIDVGPNITTNATLNATVGTSGSHELYFECDCGTLVPKVITCTALPTGFTFDGVSLISWTTSTTPGTTAVTIGVTNRSGQILTKAINIVVASVVALAIDGTAQSTSATGANLAITAFSTTLTNNVIYAHSKVTGGAQTVTSVTSTSGLTFTKRTSTANGTNVSTELWAAYSTGVLTNEVVTIHYSASAIARGSVFAVNGSDATTHFDTNVSIPGASSTAVGTTAAVVITTDYANDMLVACLALSGASGAAIAVPSGFTAILSTTTTLALAYKVVSATQTAATITYAWSNAVQPGMIVDAVKGV